MKTEKTNASATSDFSPPESSWSFRIALPAGVTSISTPWPSKSLRGLLVGIVVGRLAFGCRGLAAAEHRLRRALGDQAEAPAATREEVLDQLLEVLARRLEGLLEIGRDLAIGLGDQTLELLHRRLEVRALLLELLDVGPGFLVLALGQRIDGAQRLAPAGEPFELGVDLGALGIGEGLVRGLDVTAKRLRDPLELCGCLVASIAQVSGSHLGLP